MTAYATKRDVFRYGLPRGTLSSEGRLVESALASTEVITLESHGFYTDDVLLLRAVEGGTLSAPLVAGTPYYAIRLSDSTFSLAATAGGAAINLTTNGVNMLVAIALPFDEILEFYSRFVDAFLPAHLVPLESPYPVTVTAIVAELAGKRLQLLSGVSSIAMDAIELAAKAQLERWAAAIPLRDARATGPANLAVSVTLDSTSSGRGWGSGSLP